MDKYSAVADSLGKSDEKPKKEVSHVTVRKSGTKGDHIITHHHTHPHHHPDEEKTTRGDDEMVGHMLDTMGTQNPGEATADPAAASGTPPAAGASPAASAAAPGPLPTGGM